MIKILTKETLDTFTQFVYDMNKEKQHRSGFCSTKRKNIKDSLQGSLTNPNHHVIGYCNDETLVGVVEAFLIPGTSRADVNLFVRTQNDDVYELLIKEMREAYPTGTSYFFFIDHENETLKNYLLSSGANCLGNEYELFLPKHVMKHQEFENIQPLNETYHQAMIDLHDGTFGDVYVSGAQLVIDHNKHRYVYIKIVDQELIGYSVYKKEQNRATAEVICVDGRYQRQGHGTDLIQALINHAIQDEVDGMDLIVELKNKNALSLYLKLGFELREEFITIQLQ